MLRTGISNHGSYIDRYYLQKIRPNDHILWFQSKARDFDGSEQIIFLKVLMISYVLYSIFFTFYKSMT